MKVEYTPTHHRREHNASEAIRNKLGTFLATFKAIRNKLGQKRHRYSVPEILCALRYIIKYIQQIKTAIQ